MKALMRGLLSEVHALVSEWIPFGSNQIVSLNQRLGSLDRCPICREKFTAVIRVFS